MSVACHNVKSIEYFANFPFFLDLVLRQLLCHKLLLVGLDGADTAFVDATIGALLSGDGTVVVQNFTAEAPEG